MERYYLKDMERGAEQAPLFVCISQKNMCHFVQKFNEKICKKL